MAKANWASAFLALALIYLAPLGYAQEHPKPGGGGGDQTVGTLPVVEPTVLEAHVGGFVYTASDPCVEGLEGTTLSVTRAPVSHKPKSILVHRRIGEDPGTTITARRSNLMLVATVDEPGVQFAAGDTWAASWVSGGTTFTITITQGDAETDDGAARRLDAKVRKMQVLRPRDGAATGPHFGWMPRPPRDRAVLGPPSEHYPRRAA